MAHTVDIVEQIINEMDFTLQILTNSNDGSNTTITVCKMFHSRAGLVINDTVADFKILSVDYETNTIVIKGLPLGTMTLQPPFYFHGVPYKVNDKLSHISNTRNKLPMIYLMEIVRDRVITDELSSIAKESSVKLFFLDEANFAEWDTDQHYSLAITPMNNLLETFIEQLDDTTLIDKDLIQDYLAIPHANFGGMPRGSGLNNESGHIQSVFNEHTSGMQLDITLPILAGTDCSGIC